MKCKEKILKLIRLSIFVHFAACGYSLIILAHQPPFHYVQTKHAPTSRLRAHQSLCFTFLFLKYPHELLLYPCWCITFFWRAFLLYEDWHPLLVYHLIKIYFFHIQINTRHYVIYIFSCLIPVSPNSFMRTRNCLVSSLLYFLCLAQWLAQDRCPINIGWINKWYIWIIFMYNFYFPCIKN